MFDPEELCVTCPKRSACNSLCPEAEVYANQDTVELQELPIGLPLYGRGWPDPVEKSIFTPTESKVVRALTAGKSREQIAKELGISRKNLKEVIRHIRRKNVKESE